MHYIHCKNKKCRWHDEFEVNLCTRELVTINDEGKCAFYQSRKMTEEEFYHKHCLDCGSQRCEGIGTEWFDGCRFKDELKIESNIMTHHCEDCQYLENTGLLQRPCVKHSCYRHKLDLACRAFEPINNSEDKT